MWNLGFGRSLIGILCLNLWWIDHSLRFWQVFVSISFRTYPLFVNQATLQPWKALVIRAFIFSIWVFGWMHNLVFCLQDCWMSVKVLTFVCSSSTDEFLLGVIHDWVCFVLECFVWFWYLGFVSFTCCRCRIMVRVYFVCAFFVWTVQLFSVLKLVDSWFFGLLLFVLWVVWPCLRKNKFKLGRVW